MLNDNIGILNIVEEVRVVGKGFFKCKGTSI